MITLANISESYHVTKHKTRFILMLNISLLVQGQVTIIFVVSVCLFVCAEFFSAVFNPISIKLGHMMYVVP